jgi:hypothetical protein
MQAKIFIDTHYADPTDDSGKWFSLYATCLKNDQKYENNI